MTFPTPARRPAVLYIGGTGRSGSTLLARMIGDSPRFVAAGELRYVLDRGVIQNHLCGCGAPFRECDFWIKVFDDALGGMGIVDAERALRTQQHIDRIRYIPALLAERLRTESFRTRLRDHGELLTRMYAAIGDAADADVVVDSSKDPSHAFVLAALPTVDLSVIHLVRDSRAVAYSWRRPKARPEIHWQEATMRTRSTVRTALLWDEYHLLFDMLALAGNVRFRRLRYEDFARDADGNVAGVRRWMGDFTGTRRRRPFAHDISGNPLRFTPRPVAVAEDVEWKQHMSPADRLVATVLTAPVLLRYGYRAGRSS